MIAYLLTFCRVAMAMLFAYSFATKVGNLPQFAQTIARFNILPRKLCKAVAVLLLGCELLIVLLLMLEKPYVQVAFGGAVGLLLLFTGVILITLARGIDTSCHCFGSSDKPISQHDVGRNLGLLSIATVGLWTSELSGQIGSSLTMTETLLMSIAAIIFLLIWLNLRDILQLFQIA